MARTPSPALFPPAAAFRLAAPKRGAVPIVAVTAKSLAARLKTEPERTRRWVRDMRFKGEAGAVLALPGADGALAMVDRALACTAVGSPESVRAQLADLVARYEPDEMILTGQIHDPAARLRSFEIAAEVFAPQGAVA